MKSKLYLCIKNPFTERDFERMGVNELSSHFELCILDCTAWLMPTAFRARGTSGIDHPALRRISSLAQFKATLSQGGYAMDYVGQFSPQAILMFEALRQRRIRLVVLDSGAYPSPDTTLRRRSLPRKVWDAFRHGGLRAHLLARVNSVLLRVLPDQRPDFALVSGNWWHVDPRFADARTPVSAHSFDYERFRKVRDHSLSSHIQDLGDYAVYLDEDIAGHEDNVEMGLATPASAERFYPALNRLFDRFERETGIRVAIASYPGRKEDMAHRFAGRQVFSGLTAELIRGSRLVFAHASTAISFAVLWRSPLIFLTSKEIATSWYAPWIEAPQALLKAPLASIDSEQTLPSWEAVDEAAYAAYEHTFIKAADSPDLSLWDIFIHATEKTEVERA